MSNWPNAHKVILGFAMVAVTTLAIAVPVSADSWDVGGYAGTGSNSTGGSCAPDDYTGEYSDTCYGASWQYYEYSGSDPVTIPSSGNAPGLTVPAICGEVGGFWYLGLERHWVVNGNATTHLGWQTGSAQLGSLKNYGGRENIMFFYNSGTPISSIATPSGTATASKYGILNEEHKKMLIDGAVEAGNEELAEKYRNIVSVEKEFFAMRNWEWQYAWANGIDPDTYYPFTGGHHWGWESELGFFCFSADYEPEEETKQASYYSTTNLIVNPGPNREASFDADSNQDTKYYTIKLTGSGHRELAFSHGLHRTDTNLDMDFETCWWIEDKNFTPLSRESGGCTDISSSYYYGRTTRSVYVPYGESREYCQWIHFSPQNSTTLSSKGKSGICLTLTWDDDDDDDDDGDPPPVEDTSICKKLIPGYEPTESEGITTSLSRVRNTANPDVWETTLWARPGDSIQFQHVLCPGVQEVRMSTEDGRHSGHSPTAAGPRTLEVVAGETGTCSINAILPSSDYWFGHDSQNCTPTLRNSEDVIRYSPSTSTSSSSIEYSCKVSGAQFPAYDTKATQFGGGYQLPDFSVRKNECNSTNSPLEASVAGKTIKQTLSYSGPVKATSWGEPWHSWSCCSHDYGCHTVYHSRTYYNGSKENGSISSSAEVKIPYNYLTESTVDIPNNSGVVYGGERSRVSISTLVKPRSDNPNINSTYSTISKPTTYEVVAFTIRPAQALPGSGSPIYGDSNKAYSGSAGDIQQRRACDYYGATAGSLDCQSVRRESGIYLNPDGKLSNTTPDNLLNIYMDIPDLPVGTKYCVAVGVWPSNSHDVLSGATTNDPALLDTGLTWNYSQANCVTVSKKPNVQFWGQSIYTAGSIRTSLSQKNIDYDINLNNTYNTPCRFATSSSLASNNDSRDCGVSQTARVTYGSDPETRRVFGSWSEYDTIARGTIYQFGTGAGFGYQLNNGGNSTVALPGGYTDVGYANNPSTCTYSTQTIQNEQCNSGTLGNSSINNVSLASTLNGLASRYLADTGTTFESINLDNGSGLSGESCVFTGNNYEASRSGYQCLSNGSIYIPVDRSASINQNICLAANQTVVIRVNGDLTINRNIKYGNWNGSTCQDASYSNIAELPQVIIFADNITISRNVTNVDAWLISGYQENQAANGTINTCDFVPATDLRGTIGDLNQNEGKSGGYYAQLLYDCGNPLVINGPVFASKLYLNRTHGAGTGASSIDPAEIFNLRADTYLWAHSQAQRFSQAVTTYSRELAPKF